MLTGSTDFVEALGPSPRIKLFGGERPASAVAPLVDNPLLAVLVCPSTPIAGSSDTGTGRRVTFADIAQAIALASGEATFFRTTTAADSVFDQGTVGLEDADLILDEVQIEPGSTVDIATRTVDLPYGP